MLGARNFVCLLMLIFLTVAGVLGIFFFCEASSLKQILKRSRGGLNLSAHILDADSCHILIVLAWSCSVFIWQYAKPSEPLDSYGKPWMLRFFSLSCSMFSYTSMEESRDVLCFGSKKF